MISYKFKAVLQFWKHFGLIQTTLYLYRKFKGMTLISVRCQELGGLIWIRPSSSDFSVLIQIVEEMNEFNLKEIPDLIIDAGSNIGLSARYFEKKFCGVPIVGFEPDAGNFFVAKMNTSSRPFIHLENKGIWSHSCKLVLKNPSALPWAYEFQEIGKNGELGIPAVSINELLKEYSDKENILLKLDVEGAEKEILIKNNLWISHVQWIFVEIHGPIEESIDEAVLSKGFIKKKIGEKILYTRPTSSRKK